MSSSGFQLSAFTMIDWVDYKNYCWKQPGDPYIATHFKMHAGESSVEHELPEAETSWYWLEKFSEFARFILKWTVV